jgi:Zn-dependent hydrolases, including glyoxylases
MKGNIYKITDNVYLIDTLGLGFEKTIACYLVKSNKIALIDTGYASSYLNVIEAIKSINIDFNEINYIIPTHLHLDHSGATSYLLQHMSKAKVIAHKRAFKHLIDPTKLIESVKELYGENKLRLFGIPLPINEERIEVVEEELELNLGDINLLCIYSPGHAPHQITVLIRELGMLATADSVGVIYPDLNIMIPTTPPPSFDANLAIDTLEKLAKLQPKTLLIPHFGIRNDVEDVFNNTKIKIKEWIDLIKYFKGQGLNAESIFLEIIKKISKELSKELPIYTKELIRVSVLGILKYLERI